MDKTTLVEMKIDEGWEVLNALGNAGLRLESAFWYSYPESGEWKLLLASPLVRTKGQSVLYSKIRDVLNNIKPPTQISLDDILLLSPSDPRIREVQTITSDKIFVYRLPLNSQDDAVLLAIVEYCTKNDTEFVELSKIEQSKFAQRLKLNKDTFYESIERLFDSGYLERLAKTEGNYIFRLSSYGFEAFANDIDHNFEEVIVQTMGSIMEHGVPLDCEKLQSLIGKSRFWTHFVLEILHKRGWIRLAKFLGGKDVVTLITPRGMRAADRSKKVA
ncbi:MAG: hypothetical protein AB1757_30770 [Acidobacteriota bacterium]